jgi:predicted AAA+ superfamily ATPase
MARECGVAASTVRSYYTILNDTLLGFELPPWRKRKKRRLVDTGKYFFFDIGVANYLSPEVQQVVPGSNLYGRAFEHFLINEIRAFQAYHCIDSPLAYWRTSSGFEVDLILGNMNVALEFKASAQVSDKWLRGLRALAEEHAPQQSIIVSLVEKPLKTEDGIHILPWRQFCRDLWRGTYHQKINH